jgi:hypothetical protein
MHGESLSWHLNADGSNEAESPWNSFKKILDVLCEGIGFLTCDIVIETYPAVVVGTSYQRGHFLEGGVAIASRHNNILEMP